MTCQPRLPEFNRHAPVNNLYPPSLGINRDAGFGLPVSWGDTDYFSFPADVMSKVAYHPKKIWSAEFSAKP